MPFFGGGGGGAGIGGSTGATDNAVLRADGTGAATLKNSALVIDDPVVSFAITGVASTDIITAVGHNFTTNQGVRFTSLTGGSGLSSTINYFIRNISGDTFQVSTSSGGSAVNFTTDITAGSIVAHNENVTITNQSSETNSALVITPKGNGAFVLGPKPDGTTSGGNRRGAFSVDLQIQKAAATTVASGQGACIAGGNGGNAASGQDSFVCGNNNTSSGNGSFIGGGFSNTASGNRASVIGGRSAVSDRQDLLAYTTCAFAVNGDAQKIFYFFQGKTTTSSAVELLAGGIGTAAVTRLTVPSGKTMACIVNIAASTSGGEFANMYVRQFIIANRGGTTALRGSVQAIGTDIEGIAGADVSITADDTNDSVKIEFTGVAPVTGCTANAATDVISKVAHGYSNNDDIVFTSLTGGVGLTANTVTYWVINANADDFQVSATRGGAAVNITTNYTDMTAARLFRVVASVDAVEIGHGT